MNGLTEAEVLDLKEVLVDCNTKIRRIVSEVGTRGAGNTNTSDYHSDEEFVYTLDKLNGSSVSVFNPFADYECVCDKMVGIAAVVEDVVYIITESCYSGERAVSMVELGKTFYLRTEVAYDTMGLYYLRPEE